MIAWDLPADVRGWSFRLHFAPEGGLDADAEAITGGASVPLTLDPAGLPADVQEAYPHLASYEALRLSSKDAQAVEDLLTGQVVVAAYDDLGRLVDATGVQIPGVLDDVYAGAVDSSLGVSWRGGVPKPGGVGPDGEGRRPAASARRRVVGHDGADAPRHATACGR